MTTNEQDKKEKLERQLLEIRGNLHLLHMVFDRTTDDTGPVLIEAGEAGEIAASIDRMRRLIFRIYDNLGHWQYIA